MAASSPISHSDLVDSRTYFKSPIETLVGSMEELASHHISISDLLHAYNTFSARVRLQIGVVLTSNITWSALTPLQFHSAQVVCALRRDIRRVLERPSFVPISASLLQLQPQAGSSSDTTGTNLHHSPITREAVELAHQALRFLSDIFRFPTLHTIFSCTSGSRNQTFYITHAVVSTLSERPSQ